MHYRQIIIIIIIIEHESDGDINYNWRTRYSHQRLSTGIGGFGNKRTSGDYSNDNIIKISWNTAKSPGDLRRHAQTQTPVKTIS